MAESLGVAGPLVRETRLNREGISSRIEDGFLDATTVMEFLIVQGVPMRLAHEAVGKLVRLCEERRCRLRDLPPDAFDAVRPGMAQQIQEVLGVENAVRAFRSVGSTGLDSVQHALKAWSVRIRAAEQPTAK
jgi:argininosuccinate lyase